MNAKAMLADLGWPEITGLVVIVLLLLAAKMWPELGAGFKHGLEEFIRAAKEVRREFADAWQGPTISTEDQPMVRFDVKLWIAQGFGLGRLPLAPGTFGSLGGVLWFVLLLVWGNFWIFLAGTLAGLALSIWLCGVAEKSLSQTDPPSVVLDEIAAVPLCFLPWILSQWLPQGSLPAPAYFFGERTWYLTLVIFALFRVFDVAKPWPVRQSQRLPGGWGVTADDILAALYVALLTLVFVG